MQMGDYPDAMERYMRLAFKAQSLSRATLETLAEMKNPTTVFAQQANISNGGPQQVNNGTPAQAEKTKNQRNELLRVEDDTSLDTGGTITPGRADPLMATMGTIDRPQVSRGQGSGGKERLQGRSARAIAGDVARAQ